MGIQSLDQIDHLSVSTSNFLHVPAHNQLAEHASELNLV